MRDNVYKLMLVIEDAPRAGCRQAVRADDALARGEVALRGSPDGPNRRMYQPRRLAMLTKADELRVRLLDSASGPVAPVPFAVFRAQPIRAMVVEVLAEAATDLRTGEVRARIAQRLGDPVSWSSVRNALVDLAGRPDGPIERVAYGRYRSRVSAPLDASGAG